MDKYPFSTKQRVFSCWGSSSFSFPPQMDGWSPVQLEGVGEGDGSGGVATVNPILDDPFGNLSELVNFDTFMQLCNSSGNSQDDQLLPYRAASFQRTTPSNFTVQDEVAFQESKGQMGFSSNVGAMDEVGSTVSVSVASVSNNGGLGSVPRPLGCSLADKMLRALSLFRESTGGGILAQVWVPIKHGNDFILTTYEQPYLLDQMLAGYREISRAYTFSAIEAPGSILGLPGRVFISRMPEWISNVVYYSKAEYLRVQHAVDHQVRGSLALPIFDPVDRSCCAVLEMVTMKEKPNFDQEMENVCRALQAVNLRTTTPPWVRPKCISKNQKAVLAEIVDILRIVCHSHSLPLALTWIPVSYSENLNDDFARVWNGEVNRSIKENSILCIEEKASYVSNAGMQAFVHACAEHYLKKGQVMAGKALQSNQPFFSPDVKVYDIREYPLVHHARRFNLNAAVAIRLRSTYTGNDDYILEFFLPINCKGSSEQQLLLNSLSGTMQKICKSLRTVSEAELVAKERIKWVLEGRETFPSTAMPGKSSLLPLSEREQGSRENLHIPDPSIEMMEPDASATHEQKRQLEKKQSTVEKNISLSILQQYFSGSLKDAAKSIGVCPTTLKRICRQHGISRWPSRKINKVNRSLKKIQTVINSVQGVEGGLKFDPVTGGLVAAASMVQGTEACNNLPHHKTSVAGGPEVTNQDSISLSPLHRIKSEMCDGYQLGTAEQHMLLCTSKEKEEGSQNDNSKFAASDSELLQSFKLENTPNTSSNDACKDSCFVKEKYGKQGFSFESSDYHVTSVSSSSIAAAQEMDTGRDGNDGVVERNQPTSSGMTDSSNGSGSTMHGSASSSPNYMDHHMRTKTDAQNGSTVTVKASYKEDTVRFKFERCSRCVQLFEEVGKRFKMPIGTFQLKYLDDEMEWVMLANDADLQECMDILESVGSRSVKLLVRDVPCAIGSSNSKNCF